MKTKEIEVNGRVFKLMFGVLFERDNSIGSDIEVVTDDSNDRYYLNEDDYLNIHEKLSN